MLSITLKEETKDLHAALEKVMIPMIKDIRASGDYIRILELFYSYFGGLEAKVEAVTDLHLPDHHLRRKKEAIANDILSLGGTLPALTPDRYLPEMNDKLQAIGALYVMEGSTLGGLYISKMIAKQLNLRDGESMSFFDGYGEKTEEMWNAFKSNIDRQVDRQEEQAIVIQTANDTFKKFKSWIGLKTTS
ncbi:biliverdin-producing heme oxygenase [Arcticibacter pallidicorallinus]|nr:biliverdin-producing heme oxygenase [Arcticibacter pallidicorallinus]